MIPGIGLALPAYWKPIALAAALALAVIGGLLLKGRIDLLNLELKGAKAEAQHTADENKRLNETNGVLAKNRQDWANMAKRVDELARQSAAARSVEAAELSKIKASVVSAKEGIQHDPQASTGFVFSNAAYSVLRPGAEGGGALGSGDRKAAGTPASVGRR